MFNFDAQYFKRNQKLLLKVANNKFTCWLLGLNRLPAELKGKKIGRITPNSFGWEIGKPDKYNRTKKQMIFFSRPRFGEALAYSLTPFVYFQNFKQRKMIWRFSPVGLITCLILLLIPKGSFFGFAGTTYYSGYGECGLHYNDYTWSTVRGASVAQVMGGNGNIDGCLSILLNGNHYYNTRFFMKFDTSDIDTATITAASVFAKNSNTSCLTGTSSVCLLLSTANDTLATSDYNEFTTDLQSDTIIAYSAIAGADRWNEFALNATGEGNIQKTGITKFVLMNEDQDRQNSAPAIDGGGNGYAYFYNSTYTGTDHDPYLSVTTASGTAWIQDLSETISLADSIKKSPEKRTTENPAVADSLTKLSAKSLADNPTISDNLYKENNKSLTDVNSLSDSISKNNQIQKTETINLSDALIKTINKIMAENLSISDSDVKDISKSLEEILGLSDAVSLESKINLTDAMAMAETGLTLTIDKNISDNIAISDIQGLVADLNKALSDNLGISEALAIIVGYYHTIADSVAFSDVLGLILTPGKVLNDSVMVYDIKKLYEYDDPSIRYDEPGIRYDFEDGPVLTVGKYLNDGMTVSEAMVIMTGYYRNLIEQLNISDELKIDIEKRLLENISLVDSQVFSIEKILTDMITMSDFIQMVIDRVLSDNVAISELLIKDVGKVESENITITDTISKQTEKLLNENPALAESLNKEVGKTLSESLSIFENINAQTGLNINDNLLVIEVLKKDIGKNLDENITVYDLVNKSFGFQINIQDNLSVIEHLVKDYNIRLADALAVVDSVQKQVIRGLDRKTIIPKGRDRIIGSDMTDRSIIINEKKDKIILISKI